MNATTNMPIAPYAHKKHTIAFRECKPFDMSATVRVISTHNPWRPGSRAFNLFEQVLRQYGANPTTIGQILDDAEAIGYFRNDAARHLRWLYTWGDFMEVNGVRYFPEVPVPLPVMTQQRVNTAIPSDRKRRQTKRS